MMTNTKTDNMNTDGDNLDNRLLLCEPDDGMRVRQRAGGVGLGLEVFFRVGGELAPLPGGAEFVEVQTWPESGPRDAGACLRLQLLLEAVARYLNTGGDWAELERTLRRTRAAVPWSLNSDPYHLLMTDLTADVQPDGTVLRIGYEHYFLKEGATEGVLWSEGLFVESVDLHEHLRRFEAQAGQESDPDSPLAEVVDHGQDQAGAAAEAGDAVPGGDVQDPPPTD